MSNVFLNILVVLVAAKLAAELAERINVPTVAAEIVAGILIGPSVLGLVKHGIGATSGPPEVLSVLGEIGVILLLLEVGMQMDLRELKAVGRASMTVAVIGVIAPMSVGLFACQLLGMTTNQSLFAASALAD